MAYIKEKTISGSRYLYLTRSIRLPDGSVKTIQKLIKKRGGIQELEKEHSAFFLEAEKRLNAEYAIKRYGTDSILTKQQTEKVEGIKAEYRQTIKRFSKQQLKDALDRFTANFTYESNALEGNSLTLKDVSMVLFEGLTIEGKDLREIYETRNSRDVVQRILEGRYKIREKHIIGMHETRTRDMDAKKGYKKVPNYILGSKTELTLPENVEDYMGALIDWYHRSIKTTHPLKLAADFHGRFERIHPFEDGNGRVGRFLINVLLTENKYPPIIIRKTQRESYLRSLQDYDRGYTTNLYRFVLERYKKTYSDFFEIYLKYLR